MPINFPDNLKSNNPNFPLIKASDTTVQGYAHVADITARNAFPAAKRLEGNVIVVGQVAFIYESSDLGDTAWQTSSNWTAISGGSGLTVDTINPASTTTSSLTYDSNANELNFTPIDITGKQDTLTGVSDVPGLVTDLAAKADKQTFTQLGGSITGTINSALGQFTLSAPGLGGGDALTTNALDQFNTVTFTSLTTGDFLKWTGSAWENVVPVKADISDFVEADYAPASHTHVLADVTDSGTLAAEDAAALSVSILPDTDDTLDLGSADFRFHELHGDLDGAVLLRCKNLTGGTSVIGQPVFISGHSGTTPQVGLADNNNPAALPAIGLAQQAVPANAELHVVTHGEMLGVDTSAFAEGDELYVGDTPGALTNVLPLTEAKNIQHVGHVLTVHASNGVIIVAVDGVHSLPNLDRDQFFLGDATGLSVATDFSTAADARIAASVIDDISDVDTTTATPNTNEVLTWDGSNWTPDSVSYNDLTQVPIFGLAATTNNYGDLAKLPTFVGGTSINVTPVVTSGQTEYTVDFSGSTGDALTTSALDQFNTVTFGTLANRDVLRFNGSTSQWENVNTDIELGSLNNNTTFASGGGQLVKGIGIAANELTFVPADVGTAAPLDVGISDTNVLQANADVADNDFLRVAGTKVEGRSASDTLIDIGAQAALTFGIGNDNAVEIDGTDIASGEYAKFTANGLESKTTGEVLTDIGAAASSHVHSATTDITSGTLPVARGGTGLTSVSTLLNSNTTKSDVGLSAVENTAVSTWAGSGNITTVGTISSGTWGGTAIAYSALSGKPVLGTAAALDVGTGANNVVQLSMLGSMPAVSGSALTGLNASNFTSGTLAVARGGTGSATAPMIGVVTAADVSAARGVLGVTNEGSYTGHIETGAVKEFTLDPTVATSRTITQFYIQSGNQSGSGGGTGTVILKKKSGATVTTLSTASSVSNSSTTQTITVSSLAANDRLYLECTVNSSLVDVIFSVEYTE